MVETYKDPEDPEPASLAVGDKVLITTGPLKNFHGIARNVPDKGPVTVELRGSALKIKISACYLR